MFTVTCTCINIGATYVGDAHAELQHDKHLMLLNSLVFKSLCSSHKACSFFRIMAVILCKNIRNSTVTVSENSHLIVLFTDSE